MDINVIKDKIRGSLLGGAAGDALGYPIEFDNELFIHREYGENGILEYHLRKSGKAIISDDTQMTLFTANGLLVGEAMRREGRDEGNLHKYALSAYYDWLLTQECDFDEVETAEREDLFHGGISWLLNVPELFDCRAPGRTCLSALRHPKNISDFFTTPVNDSKGSGGIMRVAPIALLYNPDELDGGIKELDTEGAYIAAVTHGHPLGYMSAAVVVHIISRLVYGKTDSLEDIIVDARNTCKEVFSGYDCLNELMDIIDLAIELSKNDEDDLDNIHKLGEGWVAEEALGIALYCALKYQNDFSKALQVSVNHKGDSDSTGAVTGNILGALIGFDAIEDKWKNNLELYDVIIDMADDMFEVTSKVLCSEKWNSRYNIV